MINIDYLKHYPDFIPELATIWHEVLGKIWVPDVPMSHVEENLRNHLNIDRLPLTFLAMDALKPVGMCSLRVTDGILPSLTPWLGSLVVAKAYQKQGIARGLIDKTKEKAQAMNFKTLYLFAFDPKVVEYYLRLEWSKIGVDKFRGHPVTVMEIKL